MGVYTRYKKSPEGFRQLVELLEQAPQKRRQKMIDVGMQEDAEFTRKALQYVINFSDILSMPDYELLEVLLDAPPRIVATAIYPMSEEVKQRFIKTARPPQTFEIKEFLDMPDPGLTQIGGAQLKVIESARKLEKKGLIQLKRIPNS